MFRKLARQPIWQMRYALTKNLGTNLFKGSVTEWNQIQVIFTSWLAFYYNIYNESYEKRPPDEVIEDDEKLDQWLEKQKNVDFGKSKGHKTAHDEKEVFEFG